MTVRVQALDMAMATKKMQAMREFYLLETWMFLFGPEK